MSTGDIKDPTKTTTSKANQVKAESELLSVNEIRKLTSQGYTGFPAWAIKKYEKTHKLRWISQRKIYNEKDQVDQRGYQLVKNPKTGKYERRSEQYLGAMPLELYTERSAEVKDLTEAQEEQVRESIQSQRDQIHWEMSKAGYKIPETKFDYAKGI